VLSVILGGIVNRTAVHKGLIFAAVEADPKTDPGKAVSCNTDRKVLVSVEVGALPDMVTFTPEGKRVLVGPARAGRTTLTRSIRRARSAQRSATKQS
jgi:hypothetical protein